MTPTLYGCSFTDLWVSVDDWKTTKSKAALKQDWYVQCYFFDPLFKDKYPKGRVFRRRLNKLKTLEERQAAAAYLLKEIPKMFLDGYNHITEKYMVPEVVPEPEPDKLSPDMPIVTAIEAVWDIIRNDALQSIPPKERDKVKPFDDVRIAKNRFVKGLQQLRYDDIPVGEVKLSIIKETISHIKITDGYYNKFMSYMSKLYTELIEYGCIEQNPFKLFKKKKNTTKAREVLTDEQFDGIMSYLKNHHYGLYRYAMVFYQSGARSTELMMVQKKDVDLERQEYKVLIKKGNQYVEEIKVIMKAALPLWQELMKAAKYGNYYLFSEWLKPGPEPIAPRQISRKWNKYIKKRYSNETGQSITADFYALKHRFLDRLDAQQEDILKDSVNLAQLHASHRSSNITNAVYLVNKKKREREILKQITVT